MKHVARERKYNDYVDLCHAITFNTSEETALVYDKFLFFRIGNRILWPTLIILGSVSEATGVGEENLDPYTLNLSLQSHTTYFQWP